jgi:hypothetical protein
MLPPGVARIYGSSIRRTTGQMKLVDSLFTTLPDEPWHAWDWPATTTQANLLVLLEQSLVSCALP